MIGPPSRLTALNLGCASSKPQLVRKPFSDLGQPARSQKQINPRPDNAGFACFLSHYKVEAGSDARYLKDLLGKIMHDADCYLDSSNLVDLTKLFENFVFAKDTGVVSHFC